MGRFFRLGIFSALIFAFLLSSCGGTRPPVQGEKALGREVPPEGEVSHSQPSIAQDQAVEILDLRTNITILQSEIIQLKSLVIKMRSENAQLKKKLLEKQHQLAEFRGETGERVPGEEMIEVLASPLEKAGDYGDRYQQALDYHFDNKDEDALVLFQILLGEDAQHPLADNCQYWIGETYYTQGEYERALEAFSAVPNYGDSNKAADARLKMGLCYLKLGQEADARREFQRLIEDFPESEYVKIAKEYLGKK